MSETIEVFARRVADLLAIEFDGAVNPHDSLYDDWGLDSLQGFQLLVLVEAMADVLVPPIETPHLLTVQDAFDYYQSLVAVGQ